MLRANERPECARSETWPPKVVGRDRVIALLALALAATSFFIPPMSLGAGLAMSVILASLIGLLLHLLTKLPPARAGADRHRWPSEPGEEGGRLDEDAFAELSGGPWRQ